MASPYDVAIHLSLVSNVSEGLAVIVSRLAAADAGVGKLQKGLAALKPAVVGAVAAFAGFETLKGLWDLAKGSKELLNQQEQLRRAGISNLDVLRLTADAYERIGKAVPTASASDILRTVGELRAVTGKGHEGLMAAEALAPKAMMVDALLSNTFGKEMHGEYYRLLRSSEMKGIATDPAKREALTDAAFSYITGFHGKLTAQDFQTFARRGGTAWMNMKPESFGPAAVAMADLGGSAAGTAMMTLQQLQQGTMTLSKQQADTLKNAGLLDMSKTRPTGFGGGRLQLDPGAILGSIQYAGDLAGWVKNVVYPHMMAAAGGDEALFQNMLGKEAPNRNAAKMIEMFGNKGFLDQIAKDLGLAGQVAPVGQAYQSFISTNPVGVESAYEAQKKSMLEAIGSPIMQAAIPVMHGVTVLFEKIGEFANANPGSIKLIAESVGVLAAAMVVLGGVAVIGAMAAFIPGGAFAAGATALAAVVGTLAALNWDAIDTLLKAFVAANEKFIQSILSFPMDAFKAINDAFKRFVSFLLSLPENFFKWMRGISYEGGGFGGGGVTRTAWSGGGGGAGSALSSGEHAQYASMIRQYGGAQADNLLKIYGSEGAGGYVGDYGSSFGPFQLHMGALAGGGNRFSGMGDLFKRETGLDPRDKSTVRAQIEWMRRYGETHGGYSSGIWHGLRRNGGSLRAAPHGETHIHNHIYMDGKQIARNTSKHLANHAQYATSVGRQDGRGTFMGPGAEVFS